MPKALHILLFVSILAIVADAFLFAGYLTRGTSLIALLVSGIVALGIVQRTKDDTRSDGVPALDASHRVGLWILFALSTGAFFTLLFEHPITQAVRSPWAIVPMHVLFAFGIAFACALALRRRFVESIVTFAYLGIAGLAYPLGFGFDSFLHRAAEIAIAKTGSIEPLPILYGGQYALVVALHHLTQIPIDAIDRFLVPALAALSLPSLFRLAVGSGSARHGQYGIGLLVLLPLAAMSFTTPFALGALLFLVVAVLCAREAKHERLLIALPIALAATAIHVIAGVPALILVGLSFVRGSRNLVVGSLVTACAIPSLLALRMLLSGQWMAPHFSLTTLQSLFTWVMPSTTYRIFEDTLYLTSAIAVLLWVLFAGIGLLRKQQDSRLNHVLSAVLGLVLSGLLLTTFQFPDVIGYEQTDYAKRLLLLAGLGMTPFVALGFGTFVERLERSQAWVRVLAGLALSLVAMGQLYMLSPRADRHVTSKGFNVSASDYLAAQVVHTDAGTDRHIVLSPQTTSAAFVHQHGFPETITTARGEILPYAIPTGGALYQYFLRITEDIDTQAVSDALQFTDADTAYVLLPTWWWRFEEIQQALDRAATGTFTVNDIQVWKFIRR